MKIKLNRTERGRAEDWRFLTEGRRVMPSPDSLLFYKKGKKIQRGERSFSSLCHTEIFEFSRWVINHGCAAFSLIRRADHISLPSF